MSHERRVLRKAFWGILSLLIAHCSVLPASTGSLTQQAELAWKDRDKPGQTEQAIQLWQQAVKAEPARGELWTLLTKACGRAVRHAKTPAERKRWADLARDYGKKAIHRSPQSSDAYAAYGEALGQWADAHKGIHSLKTVRQAVEALTQAVHLDPKNAYAHMLLSSFYREAPGVISVGDKAKALEQAKLAVEYGPGYAINHLVLAKIDLDRGLKDQAIEELRVIMKLTPPPDAIPETRADQATSAAMLKDLDVLAVAPPCGETGGYCTDATHP
jgi:tetratricopeptide (TPR) repeat protein